MDTRSCEGSGAIRVGQKHFAVLKAEWNSQRQLCEIDFEDSQGNVYHTTAMGSFPNEVRQAVFDTAARMMSERGQ